MKIVTHQIGPVSIFQKPRHVKPLQIPIGRRDSEGQLEFSWGAIKGLAQCLHQLGKVHSVFGPAASIWSSRIFPIKVEPGVGGVRQSFESYNPSLKA
jgi:hypothetical protein